MEQIKLSHWHVLYIKYRHEKKVEQILNEKKIEVFLPLVQSIRIWSDRKKKIFVPLFNRYLFIKVSSKKEFFQSLSTEGVIKYLKFGNEYAIVRESEILQIKQLLNLEGAFDVKVESELPLLGQRMKICHGPLSGMECEVINVNNKRKVVVRLKSIQHSITAQLPNQYLVPE